MINELRRPTSPDGTKSETGIATPTVAESPTVSGQVSSLTEQGANGTKPRKNHVSLGQLLFRPDNQIKTVAKKPVEVSEAPKFETIFVDKEVLVAQRGLNEWDREIKQARAGGWGKKAKAVLEGPLVQDENGHTLTGEEILSKLPNARAWEIAVELKIKVKPKIRGRRSKVVRRSIFGEKRLTPTRDTGNPTETMRRAIAELKMSFEPKKPEIVEIVLDPNNLTAEEHRYGRKDIEKFFHSPFKTWTVGVTTTSGYYPIFWNKRALNAENAKRAAMDKLRELQVKK